MNSITRETDSSQATTATKQYDAFGMPLSSTGSSASPFGFAGCFGYQEDGDSGLKLLGHRYYDPSTGRFLTRDPAKDGRNWYGYCENNPVSLVDPEGFHRSLGRCLLYAVCPTLSIYDAIVESRKYAYMRKAEDGYAQKVVRDEMGGGAFWNPTRWAAWPIEAAIAFMSNSVETTHPAPTMKVPNPPVPFGFACPVDVMPQRSTWDPKSDLEGKPSLIEGHQHIADITDDDYDGPFGKN